MKCLKFSEINTNDKELTLKKIWEIVESENAYIDKLEIFVLLIITSFNKDQEILLCLEENKNKLIGFCLLKKTEKEKKIFYLHVDTEYSNQESYSALIEKACEFLETDKPILCLSSLNYSDMIQIIKEKGWILTSSKLKKNYLDFVILYNFNKPPKSN